MMANTQRSSNTYHQYHGHHADFTTIIVVTHYACAIVIVVMNWSALTSALLSFCLYFIFRMYVRGLVFLLL